MFKSIRQLFSGRKHKAKVDQHTISTCPDCGTPAGGLHDLFCTREYCPFCRAQLITCDCIRTVLELSAEERRALDEYVDDSIPPLSDVMLRWKAALTAKGRIPFKAFPDDPIRAAYRGDVEAVRLFIDEGFAPNSGNEVGYTMLMAAARGASQLVIRTLLSKGASATIADTRGFTAMHWAVAQSTTESGRQVACVRALLDAGADPNARSLDGGTPLMNAAWFGDPESVEELLRRGADRSAADDEGRTARDLAASRRHNRVLELLS